MFNLQKLVGAVGRTAYRTSVLTSRPVAPSGLRPMANGGDVRCASTSTTPATAIKTPSAETPPTVAATATSDNADASARKLRSKNPMVAAAFQSLLDPEEKTGASEVASTIGGDQQPDAIDERIINAKTVSGLLSVADDASVVTRKHALKVVSILAEWSSINRVQLADFENDARFIKLCRLLGRAVTNGKHLQREANGHKQAAAANSAKIAGFRTDDLNTVIGVAGDDEAAKLIASISIPQMIKVMSALAAKKRRSTPLLRSLAYNISSNSGQLDLKQCADLLYAMAVLNFPDTVLIGRISMDVQNGLQQNRDKPAAVGSIITSLGLLKYRDADLLESLTDWVLQHSEICRPQDVSSLFLTLATLNYPTTKAEAIKTKLVANLSDADFKRSLDWLNNVWALVVLNFAESQHIASVLKNDFIERLAGESASSELSATTKLKLLNIDAATALQATAYAGDRLPEASAVFAAPLQHSKNKVLLVDGMLDALKSLFASEQLVRTQVNTRMGFAIDAECVLDAKNRPLPVDGEHKNAVRLAIMVQDFHDMSQGAHQQPNGVTALAFRLLEQKGYRVVTVPYNEFNSSEKLLKRVQYLEGKLKRIAANKE